MAGYTPALPSMTVNTTTSKIVLSSTLGHTFPLAVQSLWVAASTTVTGYVLLLEGSTTGEQKVKVQTGLGGGSHATFGNGVAFTSKVYAELATGVKGATITYTNGATT